MPQQRKVLKAIWNKQATVKQIQTTVSSSAKKVLSLWSVAVFVWWQDDGKTALFMKLVRGLQRKTHKTLK